MHDHRTRLAAVFLFFLAVAAGPASAADRRPLTPDDLFRIEEVGEVAIAPDGADAAIVIRSPVAPGRGHGRPLLLGGDRSDIFLVPMGGGDPRPLTDGKADGSGYWRPLWSPDGRRLALLSTRGGDNVRLFVWDRQTGQTRRVTEDGVDLWAAVEPITKAPFAWVDDHRLICALVPPGGAHTAFTLEFPVRKGATEGWAKAARGDESTASVLESGKPAPPVPTGRLAVVDADDGTVRTVADGNCIEALPSPDGRHVAVVVETGRQVMREGKPLPAFTDRAPCRAGIADLDGPPSVRWVSGVEPKAKIRRMQFTWSADSSRVAILGKPDPDADRPDALFLADLAGTARRVKADDFRATATARVGTALLALGRFGASGRDDWWLVDPSDAAKPENLTAAMPAVPEAWFPEGDLAGRAVAAGKVWRLDPATRRCEEILLPGGRKPMRAVRPAGPNPGVLVECRPLAGAAAGEFVLLAPDPAAEPLILGKPDPEAKLVEAGPGASAVFSAVTPDGSTAWTTAGAAKPFAKPFALNGFLAEIADAPFRVIDYRGSDGNPLKAHLLLPPGHKEGEKHPTVVWVYAGTVLGTQREALLQKNSRHPMNLVLLASRGYAVLVPSMPLGPEGQPADPLIELPKGVLPAVDKAVELGLADPARLAVLGHSYGGYSVYGLLTQTRRFKAGIAMAGITDLVAIHGSLDARVRYQADPFFNVFGPKWTEIGQGRMGASPWVDPDRFRRNSPITYVDRVRTPLLMIHGDADFVPLQQAEAFYTGLLRLGRRARLVRYWGEGHMPESPANVRDLWSQVFAWLDEHLAIPDSPKGRPAEAEAAGSER